MREGRNQQPLDDHEIEYCQQAWTILCGETPRELDVSEARTANSETKFNESQQKVFLGANAYPGDGSNSIGRMSPLACLAHELAHWERAETGRGRSLNPRQNYFIDEAETSLDASFTLVLSDRDRKDLVEAARDRLNQWILYMNESR
jgi:hypothetical protein